MLYTKPLNTGYVNVIAIMTIPNDAAWFINLIKDYQILYRYIETDYISFDIKKNEMSEMLDTIMTDVYYTNASVELNISLEDAVGKPMIYHHTFRMEYPK